MTYTIQSFIKRETSDTFKDDYELFFWKEH